MKENKDNGLEKTKKAIRKRAYKQTMWRVYKRTRKGEDYTYYKEALKAATTEIIHYKRSYEHKLAYNINITAIMCIHMSGVNRT